MEIPARIGNGGIGAIIAVVGIVFGALVAAEVLPLSPAVIGFLFIASFVARLT